MCNLQLLLLVDRVVRYASERCTRNSSPVSQYWVRINLRLVAFAKSLRSAWGLLIQKVLRRTCIHHVSFSTCNIITKLQKNILVTRHSYVYTCNDVIDHRMRLVWWCQRTWTSGSVWRSPTRWSRCSSRTSRWSSSRASPATTSSSSSRWVQLARACLLASSSRHWESSVMYVTAAAFCCFPLLLQIIQIAYMYLVLVHWATLMLTSVCLMVAAYTGRPLV